MQSATQRVQLLTDDNQLVAEVDIPVSIIVGFAFNGVILWKGRAFVGPDAIYGEGPRKYTEQTVYSIDTITVTV